MRKGECMASEDGEEREMIGATLNSESSRRTVGKAFCARIDRQEARRYTRFIGCASARLQPGRSKRMRVVAGGSGPAKTHDPGIMLEISHQQDHVYSPYLRRDSLNLFANLLRLHDPLHSSEDSPQKAHRRPLWAFCGPLWDYYLVWAL